jgi:hypothetical protein
MFDLRTRPRLWGVQRSGKGKLVHRLGIQFACGLWPTITPGMSAEQELHPRVNSMTVDRGGNRGNRPRRHAS